MRTRMAWEWHGMITKVERCGAMGPVSTGYDSAVKNGK